TLLPLLSILFCILHPPQPTLFPYTTLFRSDKKISLLGCVLELLISTAGGRFHFITVQGRHLFKETTFTVSTLPRAWLEPPCASHSGVSRLMLFPQDKESAGSIHRTKKIGWYLRGVGAFRSNQRCSASKNERWYILQFGLLIAKSFMKLTGVNQKSKANR